MFNLLTHNEFHISQQEIMLIFNDINELAENNLFIIIRNIDH